MTPPRRLNECLTRAVAHVPVYVDEALETFHLDPTCPDVRNPIQLRDSAHATTRLARGIARTTPYLTPRCTPRCGPPVTGETFHAALDAIALLARFDAAKDPSPSTVLALIHAQPGTFHATARHLMGRDDALAVELDTYGLGQQILTHAEELCSASDLHAPRTQLVHLTTLRMPVIDLADAHALLRLSFGTSVTVRWHGGTAHHLCAVSPGILARFQEHARRPPVRVLTLREPLSDAALAILHTAWDPSSDLQAQLDSTAAALT